MYMDITISGALMARFPDIRLLLRRTSHTFLVKLITLNLKKVRLYNYRTLLRRRIISAALKGCIFCFKETEREIILKF